MFGNVANETHAVLYFSDFTASLLNRVKELIGMKLVALIPCADVLGFAARFRRVPVVEN